MEFSEELWKSPSDERRMTRDEWRGTNDECPRLTYSAIADNPEGGLAGKG